MNDQELEKFIHRQLRDLPARRAPRTLESRVMAALEQRAAIAWWHKSWSYWPTPVKAVFGTVATLFAGGLLAACYALWAGVDVSVIAAQVGEHLGFLVSIYHVAAWIFDFGAYVVSSIPPLWLYGGLAFVAFLYVTFFGLGAAAYRSLYRSN